MRYPCSGFCGRCAACHALYDATDMLLAACTGLIAIVSIKSATNREHGIDVNASDENLSEHVKVSPLCQALRRLLLERVSLSCGCGGMLGSDSQQEREAGCARTHFWHVTPC
jgi:hypothetical protein